MKGKSQKPTKNIKREETRGGCFQAPQSQSLRLGGIRGSLPLPTPPKRRTGWRRTSPSIVRWGESPPTHKEKDGVNIIENISMILYQQY